MLRKISKNGSRCILKEWGNFLPPMNKWSNNSSSGDHFLVQRELKRLVRGHKSYNSVNNGINVIHSAGKLTMACRSKSCVSPIIFYRIREAVSGSLEE